MSEWFYSFSFFGCITSFINHFITNSENARNGTPICIRRRELDIFLILWKVLLLKIDTCSVSLPTLPLPHIGALGVFLWHHFTQNWPKLQPVPLLASLFLFFYCILSNKKLWLLKEVYYLPSKYYIYMCVCIYIYMYIYTYKKYTRASVLFASSLIQFTQGLYSVDLHLYISKHSFA